MIIRNDKCYETNSQYPKTDWYNDGNTLFVVDETTTEGKILAKKIVQHYPYYEFVLDGEGTLLILLLLTHQSRSQRTRTNNRRNIIDGTHGDTSIKN